MSQPKATPMIQQYLEIKQRHQDAILFYRMGDFYEMFFEDAHVASKALEITLTSRNKNDSVPVPMCGVPYRAAQGYIARLIEKGHKVAICDQVEDSALAKGLVKREVVRVITPGMIVETELLDARRNNFILALCCNRSATGISFLDLSTGTFKLAQSNDNTAVLEEMARIGPSEVLLPESARSGSEYIAFTRQVGETPITYIEEAVFSYRNAHERLLRQLGTVNLEGFGCEGLNPAVGAAGALVHYVSETQKHATSHLNRIETYRLDQYLFIDEQSCQNLELIKNIRSGTRRGTVIDILDQTVTAMGGRLLNHWLRYPLMDDQKIEQRLSAVAEAVENLDICQQLRQKLKSVSDLERLHGKIAMGHAGPRDLLAVRNSLMVLPEIRTALSQLQSERYSWDGDALRLDEAARLIQAAIRDDAPATLNEGGLIKSGYNPELDELIQISRDGKSFLVELERSEKQATGINSLKVRYNKVFGYFIEVPKSRSESIPAHYVRKQTLVNAERYITDPLKHFENKVLGAEERRAALEYEIFNQIRNQLLAYGDDLKSVAHHLAAVDCLLNLAHVADQNNYHRPQITRDDVIDIKNGRHPVIEKMIAAERFVPNTIQLNNHDQQLLIITGPNMAGKSTVLRQVALLVVMAQMGSFIPAEAARISITDRIFTRVGALDNLASGQSTFMVEMQETANILNHATAQSLVVMDEIGRGTSTFDGLSIAWAVAEYLHDLKGEGVKTLFATHYHELTELANNKPRAVNFNIAVKEWNDEIIFLRKLVEGGTNRSYGIQVARLAGIPAAVIQRSKKILTKIENSAPAVTGLPSGGAQNDQGHVQLNLFRTPEQRLVARIQNIDINRMTPMDALAFLDDLQKHLKNA
jgi:DNA mismatch repair protein MutS